MLINEKIKAYISTFFTVTVWGITFISTKILLNDFAAIEILLARFILGIIILFIIYPKNNKSLNKKHEILFAIIGLSGITLYYLFENVALEYSLASNVGILVSIGPFFTGIFASIFLKEKLDKNFFIGFIFSILGIAIIGLNGKFILKINPIGDILALLSAVMWGIYSTFLKSASDLGYSSIFITKRIFIYGILFTLPMMFFIKFDINLYNYLKPINIINLIFLSFIAGTLCFITWSYSTKILGAVKTNIYVYLIPIITTVASKIVLNENITIFAVIGILLILIGVIISENNILNKINWKKNNYE